MRKRGRQLLPLLARRAGFDCALVGRKRDGCNAAAGVRWAAWLAAGVLSVLSSGCRNDPYQDAYFEMLNAEKRVLEDRLYDAEYNYEQALAELEAVRGEKKDGGKPSSRKRAAESDRPLTEPDEGESRESSGVPKEAPELPKIELPPGVEEGKRRSSSPGVMRPASAVKGESPAVTAKQRPLSNEELAAAVVSALDQRVASIQLNPRVTGGADFDGQPGDDGICVLIEPRNRSGGFVPEPASLSIVLLDPAETGEAARLARWDFDAGAAGEFLQTDSLDRGLLLRLPWQSARPERNRAHLFVRYVTPDGRKLEADREIRIGRADRIAQSWTPRPMPVPEKPADRETTASWQPPAEADKPVVAQAAAELPARSEPATEAKADKPAKPDKPASVAPRGRFWTPER